MFKKKTWFVLFLILSGGLLFWLFIVWVSLQEDVKKLKNYKPQLTTQILDRKDRLVANVFGSQFRFYARFDEIPPRMIEALLAVEDTLFFEHHGINYDAILRASIKNLRHGKYSEGGSTLTQQLIKNTILTRDKTLYRKIKEAMLAIEIESILSKEEILERYLNDTFLGHGYFGVKAAALGYFKKSLDQLTLKEITMIAGLPRAPSYYDPTKNMDFSLARANNILERMYNLGWIGESEYRSALVEIPEVYNQTLAQNQAPYVVDMVLKQLDYIQDLRTGGYVIKVGIDLDYQNIAQKVMERGYEHAIKINKLEKGNMLNGAMVVTQAKTGEILALIGGIDYNKTSFNRATQARRQIGSTIKPFIYLNAFDMGYSPATMIPDVARSFGKDDEYWRPKNAANSFNGIVSLRYALIHSLNLATINLVDTVGFEKTYNALERYGFHPATKNLTIILGSLIVTPIDLARAYSIFSNHGTMIEPNLIKEVIKPSGVKEYFHPNQEDITSPQQAYLVTSILEEVVKNGTARRARVRGMDVAGKTGTTNNNNDAWFCGFTPDIQIVIWFGNDNNGSIGRVGGGASIVAPVFSDFINHVLKIDPALGRNFRIPDGVYQKTIDGTKYFYTDISKLPEKKITEEENQLIF
nr:PBP1A family penicillin-binding protein [Helicobacter mustelae]